jgi:hypothetical protein
MREALGSSPSTAEENADSTHDLCNKLKPSRKCVLGVQAEEDRKKSLKGTRGFDDPSSQGRGRELSVPK